MPTPPWELRADPALPADPEWAGKARTLAYTAEQLEAVALHLASGPHVVTGVTETYLTGRTERPAGALTPAHIESWVLLRERKIPKRAKTVLLGRGRPGKKKALAVKAMLFPR